MTSMSVFVVTQNSDLTEGGGHDVEVGYHLDLESAVADAKPRGVMGYGSGNVYEVIISDDPENPYKKKKVWGYRKNRGKGWGYGYVDLRDDPDPNDPEYKLYLQLKEKFES